MPLELIESQQVEQELPAHLRQQERRAWLQPEPLPQQKH
jgi:hypothetical protein